MSLIKDSVVQQRHATIDPQIVEAARIDAYCKFHEDQAVEIGDDDDPTQIERQMGRAMSPKKFKDLLVRKLKIPNIRIDVNPFRPHMVWLYRVEPDGTPVYISAWHKDEMLPEYSLFSAKYEWVFDRKSLTKHKAHGLGHIERKDMPKPSGFDPVKGYVYDDDTPRPGWKRERKAWNEVRRGWRTTLARLVAERLVSIDAVERAVGGSERRAWAAHTGKDVTSRW